MKVEALAHWVAVAPKANKQTNKQSKHILVTQHYIITVDASLLPKESHVYLIFSASACFWEYFGL